MRMYSLCLSCCIATIGVWLWIILAVAKTTSLPGQNHSAADSSGVSASRFAYLSRGVNLDGWFHEPPDQPPYSTMDTFFTVSDALLLKRLGIRHVRLPIEPNNLFNPQEPEKLNPLFLSRLDNALDLLLSHELAVIIVPMVEGDTDTFGARLVDDPHFLDAFCRFWQTLGSHLRRRDPDKLFLEVLNEPVLPDRSDAWNRVLPRLVSAVRVGAPKNTIILSGNDWSSIDGLLRLATLEDHNVVYNFHCYDPEVFTHQGATWAGREKSYLHDIPYPSSPEALAPVLKTIQDSEARQAARQYGAERWNQARLEHLIARASDWAQRHHVYLTCNEFGAYEKAPAASRVRWLQDMRIVLEQHGIGWCLWDYGTDFALAHGERGSRTADPAAAQALGLQP